MDETLLLLMPLPLDHADDDGREVLRLLAEAGRRRKVESSIAKDDSSRNIVRTRAFYDFLSAAPDQNKSDSDFLNRFETAGHTCDFDVICK